MAAPSPHTFVERGGDLTISTTISPSHANPNSGSTSNADVPAMPLRPLVADPMRAYRACLNCRGRKSKCDLEVNNGRPPCRRCQREDRECVLGESHRGGRRVRKKPKLEDDAALSSPALSQAPTIDRSTSSQAPHPNPFPSPYETPLSGGLAWQTPVSASTTSSDQILRQAGQRNDEDIASADLQNPSDALEILAQVADQADEGESSLEGEQQGNQLKRARPMTSRQELSPSKMDDLQLYYKPVQDGMIAPEMVYHLFSSYEEFFHPYFPIIPRETFDRNRLPWISRYEPHLFSAILTIASKDNEQVHQVCYDHMQQLVSMILAGSGANVEAVEAMLLLSQWVSHRPQAEIAVGRGEEDRVAWMYTGTALRLGYFLGLDRTSFKNDHHEDRATFNRKRLVWAACYICDRQVSVRLGKGFWSRGPGPLSGLKSEDFPTLQPRLPGDDNWALIFQANLELTQIFSNVHDILYSSKGHGWTEMLEGRYTKYLDDFRISIRSWNDVWGTLICSAHLKTSLLLTYDYLRLYVNAFAYQATISRALMYHMDSHHLSNRPLPLINASAPDARFIYEAVDAAKSLLSTFNNFVDPETLRYMPSSYYLFIIYSAVFLYKARSTTTMTEEERTGVRRMIDQTITRLQKASMGANHMGSRYARLIQLLWRKAPIPTDQRKAPIPHPMAGHLKGQYADPSSLPSGFDPSQGGMGGMEYTPSGTFSWLDLGATWNFATQNNSFSGGSPEDGVMDSGMNLLDMSGMMTDYSLLDRDNPNLIF